MIGIIFIQANGKTVQNTSSIEGSDAICTKCVKTSKYKQYFLIKCADYNEYLECQSKCVTSEAKTPFECIRNSGCVQKCESKCKKFWPGRL